MIVGLMMFIVCIVVVCVGTNTNEAEALYYDNECLDAEYSVPVEDEAGGDTSSNFEVPEEHFEQTVTTSRPGTNTTKITVGGSDIKAKPKNFKQPEPSSLDDLASLASAKDPNAKQAAQNKYDKYMEDLL